MTKGVKLREAKPKKTKITKVLSERKELFLVLAFMVIAVVGTFAFNLFSGSVEKTFARGLDIDKGDKEILWNRYQESKVELSENLEITKSGIYHLYGNLENGMVTVDVGDFRGEVKLILDNVSINNDSGPAIYVKSADDIVIETAAGTTNYLTSGETFEVFEDEDVEGTIYSKGDLSFYGEGKLFVETKNMDGIVGKDDINIRSGEIEVVANDDGIRGKDSVFVSDGKVKINAKQDGIKSTNGDVTSKGFVYIENGEIEISAGDDGIHATTNLIVVGGKIDILSSYEGLEGAKVAIGGGTINVKATDDGINAAGGADESTFMKPGADNFANLSEFYITINGGEISIDAAGDGIDSNGKIYINGGKVVVDGPIDSSNGALDSETGIDFNGGEVIAVGASGMAEGFDDSSLGYGISCYFEKTQAKNTTIEIKDESGNVILTHVSKKTFNHLSAGSEKFKENGIYYIYANGDLIDSVEISGPATIVGEKTEQSMNPGGGMNSGENGNGTIPEGGMGPGGNNGGTPPDGNGGGNMNDMKEPPEMPGERN